MHCGPFGSNFYLALFVLMQYSTLKAIVCYCDCNKTEIKESFKLPQLQIKC